MPGLQDVEFQGGRNETQFVGSIARTDTAAKALFTLPAGCIVTGMTIASPTVSNAGTTATISVGKSGGTGAEFLTTYDVKGATGSGQQTPPGPATSLFGAVQATPITVTGVYAETGGASNAGGPWVVVFDVLVV